MTKQETHFHVSPIGLIRTPFDSEFTPSQPIDKKEATCRIELDSEYVPGLRDLSCFRYAIVLSWLDRQEKPVEMEVTPPWAKGKKVSLWAARSPRRPNPIGFHIIPVVKVEGNVIHTYGVDVYDGTPVLDIKPYIRDLDSRLDADHGWLEDVDEHPAHLIQHLRGLPHDHENGHEHTHHHDDDHDHTHGHEHKHEHEHIHDHEHEHVHEHPHSHPHGHEHEAGGEHSHPHTHVHSHEHDHRHSHGHEHSHGQAADHEHAQGDHAHDPDGNHEHGHGPDHAHKHGKDQ